MRVEVLQFGAENAFERERLAPNAEFGFRFGLERETNVRFGSAFCKTSERPERVRTRTERRTLIGRSELLQTPP